MTISIAIPTFNRFAMPKRAIQDVQDDPRVGEIVLCDDASNDGSYEKLSEWVRAFPKIRLFRNPSNLDCYANKAQALRHATLEWAILFDSDNTLTVDYLDRLYAIGQWEADKSYLPTYARPHFDYRKFSGQKIDASNVRHFMGDPVFRCALNTANYFVHRATYLEVWDPNVNPHTADSIYMNYRFLRAGKSLVFVTGLEYDHLVHDQSHYKQNHKKTGGFAERVESKLRSLR